MLAAIERNTTEKDKYQDSISKFLKEAEVMLAAIPENRDSIVKFKKSVDDLPKITIQFNQARRLLQDALDECIELFDQTERNIYEITATT